MPVIQKIDDIVIEIEKSVPPTFQAREFKTVATPIRDDLAKRDMIIDEITQILEKYNVSISDAQNILHVSSQKRCFLKLYVENHIYTKSKQLAKMY